ncbi:xanthine dehydrogenase accessory protein XdhC [Asticcacaulis excentricus]|uniref:Xanthine dehydrogenase accessory protein XdhC n=1 Tax=Asticcacaulis excentricus (strain ATCC 15261 / DSM 4724 / KCTC 12464 / NCIMB 9791 / VKM B-1370 / CB 48) TaxID=573065 RepID=E8RUY4_ASTEC|nr:xanthine dehydrogenase accessory protein XdhC [Asticcacaulis excentricus]ADU14184.1 xanthine dehydrogenase accessory protein XdhC [Asticcacaulis excentricus CB 48]
MNWVAKALDLLGKEPLAMISLLAVEGSTPREAGTRMLVTAKAIYGTIGGGNLEFQCIDQARLALKHKPGTWRIQDYPLGVLLGQCCGGRVRVMIEHLDPAMTGWLEAVRGLDTFTLRSDLHADGVRRRLSGDAPNLSPRGPVPMAGGHLIERLGQPLTPMLMFGAGHVGIAIARVVEGLPFQLRWCDERTDVPQGVYIRDAHSLCAEAEAGTGLTLILTHDHALDYELTKAALRSQARFIGLIGSATKSARFFSRLRKDGFAEAQIARITCPIGLPGITGKAPEVIAVAVAAQLLQITDKTRTLTEDTRHAQTLPVA